MIRGVTLMFWFQFRVKASDQRQEERTSETQITVVISRDHQPPRFEGAPYNVQVSENRAVNQTVTRVTAIDPDLQVKLV